MFPIGDDNSQRRSIPYVTYVLVAINVLVFLLELNNGDDFIREWAFIPARFSADPVANIPTVFSAMFMHGGWLHLGGNMLYLWIFGDNVEDRFGHMKYLAFYLLAGIAATFAQYLFLPESSVPNVEKTRNTPSTKPQSPTRLVMNAFLPASDALFFSYQ